ncbi:MAG: hypothetical protein GC154_16960 [bacterium]|nr:hypothetical protein [bacterium]
MTAGPAPPRASAGITVLSNSLSFPGILYPQRYNHRADRAGGHHFIVWSGGGNAAKALIETPVPDTDILAALESIGAVPGNNLQKKTWTERTHPDSPEPDMRVEGSPIHIFIEWNGVRRPAHEIFKDEPAAEFDIRVGGHADLIPVWKSGCVTCLFSCPGGRTSNHAFTIRDQAFNRKTFRAREDLPPDGTPVIVWMELAENVQEAR